MTETPIPSPTKEESDESRGFMIGLAVGIVVITLLLVGGAVVLAIFAEQTADEVEIIRDLFVISLTLELFVIGTALVVLLVQAARLVNQLSNEIQPIIESTADTVNTVRGTALFLSKNVTEPVMSASATLRTMRKTMKDVDAIRKVAGMAMAAASTISPTGARSAPTGARSAPTGAARPASEDDSMTEAGEAGPHADGDRRVPDASPSGKDSLANRPLC